MEKNITVIIQITSRYNEESPNCSQSKSRCTLALVCFLRKFVFRTHLPHLKSHVGYSTLRCLLLSFRLLCISLQLKISLFASQPRIRGTGVRLQRAWSKSSSLYELLLWSFRITYECSVLEILLGGLSCYQRSKVLRYYLICE